MKVKVIGNKGNMTLVQWTDVHDVPQRSWVKHEDVTEDSTVFHPEHGVPYAFDFEKVIEVNVTPKDIMRELRRQGIWTISDLRENPQVVIGALMSANGVTHQQLLKAANDYENMLKEAEKAQ